jgi:flavin reductase (DIM6/NTAB) family NADH-FMN oxidoreductase RutF
MFYEPALRNHGLPHDPLMAIVAPRPIGWISTLSPEGVVNLAPYSFFNIFSSRPPVVGYASNGLKNSRRNIEATGEFVCNLAIADLQMELNLTSAELPPDRSEFELAGLEAAPSRLVKPPRVARTPCALECRYVETIELRNARGQGINNWLVLGEVMGVHVHEACIRDGRLDVTLTRNLARCGYLDYSHIESVRAMPRPRLTETSA